MDLEVDIDSEERLIKIRKEKYLEGYRHIAFLIYPYSRKQKREFVEGTIEKFCKRNKIYLYKAKGRYLSQITFNHIIESSLLCDLGIVVMSKGHNENVAFEMGLMIALGKPIFLLRDKEFTRSSPFDYGALLYVSYDDERSLRKELTQKFVDFMKANVKYKKTINKAIEKYLNLDNEHLKWVLDKYKIPQRPKKKENFEIFCRKWDENPRATLDKLKRTTLLSYCLLASLPVNKSDTKNIFIETLNKAILNEYANLKAKEYYDFQIQIPSYIIRNLRSKTNKK
ncbi:MAG: hypothetical protein ACTSRR_09335 [Candidatus Heimdallarchaeaceae archaeon]